MNNQNISSIFSSSAPGNLFLIGEHAVVYGYPALIAAVDLRTFTKINLMPTKDITIHSDMFGKAVTKFINDRWEHIGPIDLIPLIELVEQLHSQAKFSKGLKVQISSQIPPCSGLSSSTAVLVSILNAVSRILDVDISLDDYYQYLYPYQVILHGGQASGAEIVSSCYGGLHRVFKSIDENKTRIIKKSLSCIPYRVVVADSGIPAPTKITSGKIMPQKLAQDSPTIENAFKEIANLVPKAEKALANLDFLSLGYLITENHKILRDTLNVSHPKLDMFIDAAIASGAYGAKLSGGGMGGVIFAITPPNKLHVVSSALEKLGARIFILNIGVTGVE